MTWYTEKQTFNLQNCSVPLVAYYGVKDQIDIDVFPLVNNKAIVAMTSESSKEANGSMQAIIKTLNKDGNKLYERGVLIDVLYKEIKEIADQTCAKIGISYNKIEIVELNEMANTSFAETSREKGLMKFYWKLIDAPKAALRATVIHEVCHLVHKGHSQLYWDLYNALIDDESTKSLKTWLERHTDYFLSPISCVVYSTQKSTRIDYDILTN